MYLGKCEGFECYISPNAPNGSCIITGISGGGKSCKQNQMELREVLDGNTPIILDISRNHLKKDIFYKIQSDYWKHVNYIDASKDGIGIEIFAPIKNCRSELESYVTLINSNVQALSARQNMGLRQQVILREVVEEAIQLKRKCPNYTDELILRTVFNKHKEDTKWQEIYQRLWTVLNCGVLKRGTKQIKPQAINIIDLSTLDMLSSEILSEVILAYLWRNVYNAGFPLSFGKVTIVLDEFQHVSIKKSSMLRTMLREGRRFGLSLILATQTMGIFTPEEVSMLNQTATHLYFRPADSDLTKCARMIEPSKATSWRKRLANLERGNCVAVGSLMVNGREISHPLLLR